MSDLTCTSSLGDGNYAGLYNFSCGYGFCLKPCTYLSNGICSTLLTFDPIIVGYADGTSLDADIYGSLCNFTYSHGYCSMPNACLSLVTINLDDKGTILTLSIFDNIVKNATYSPSDFFMYLSEAGLVC